MLFSKLIQANRMFEISQVSHTGILILFQIYSVNIISSRIPWEMSNKILKFQFCNIDLLHLRHSL